MRPTVWSMSAKDKTRDDTTAAKHRPIKQASGLESEERCAASAADSVHS